MGRRKRCSAWQVRLIEEAIFTLIGNLTVDGFTKLVTWEATVKLNDNTLTGSATRRCDMVNLGIEKPVAGPVVLVDETND